MSHPPPFKFVRQRLSTVTVAGVLKVNNTYSDLLQIISLLLRSAEVDESWYLEQYPHLAEALKGGDISSARSHFIHSGYFEGRLPNAPEVDEAWYLERYPDVAEGIAQGKIESARQHFIEYGYEEGRFCSAKDVWE